MYDAPAPSLRIDAETPEDAVAIDRLVMAAFGPGRFAKTAERLREHAAIATGFVARQDDRIVGCVRLWSITIGGTPALFLGPIAVDADVRRGGLGAELVNACLEAADQQGSGILLVGDTPYFGRFGFEAAPDVTLPGPVDRRRVLWRGASQAVGAVVAAR